MAASESLPKLSLPDRVYYVIHQHVFSLPSTQMEGVKLLSPLPSDLFSLVSSLPLTHCSLPLPVVSCPLDSY